MRRPSVSSTPTAANGDDDGRRLAQRGPTDREGFGQLQHLDVIPHGALERLSIGVVAVAQRGERLRLDGVGRREPHIQGAVLPEELALDDADGVDTLTSVLPPPVGMRRQM